MRPRRRYHRETVPDMRVIILPPRVVYSHMVSLVDKIKDVFTDTEESEMYTYECTGCGTQFESAKRNVGEVRCPECGASKVKDATITS